MSYSVSLSKEATKELDRLDRTTEQRLRNRLTQLAQDPHSARLSRELIMGQGERYSRVGDWRIVFKIDESQKVVDISAIQHRSRVYKDLKK